MSPEQENFQQLRRLLVLKRYEQPPPRYFQEFSEQVIARIRANEHVDEASILERLSWEAPWLRRLWSAFEHKPLLAGAFGVAVCGLLVSGIIYSERVEPITTPSIVLGNGSSEHAVRAIDQPGNPLLERAIQVNYSSTGGVITGQLNNSLFQEIRQPVQLIQHSLGGN